MKYKELFTPDKGIFTTIFKPNYPEQYGVIFGQTVPQVYDVLALLQCGNKTLLGTVTPDSYTEIVNAIIAVNVDNWVRAANAMLAEYDAMKPVKRETTRTEKTGETETFNDVSTDSRKAFNDPDFSPDSRGVSDSSKNRDTDRQTVETVAGLGESANVTEQIRKEFALRLDKWRESIIFTLVNEITTVVYN